ncbi:DUF937 domain-containing protein [Tahibacter caeni]|uniref:DUF937 domain-containing protein n=1 Tax=Tahibacter caeni TaxID=1453545 RepID=UPI0021493A94|nr:DUF937 domain-containing protein [Tahibacter caeni]
MSGLVDAVLAQIGDDEVGAIAQRFGMSPGQAQAAIEQTLPLMVGAMARNASTPDGAEALHTALGDHVGNDLGGLLGGLLGGGAASGGGGGLGSLGSLAEAVLGGMGGGASQSAAAAPGGNDMLGGIGGAILGHIFGNKRGQAEQGLGQTTGLGGANAGQLMAVLAPIVMAVLARMNQQRGLGPGGLSDMLGNETRRTREAGGIGGGLLGAVLDRDGDGDVDLSDLLNVGGSVIAATRR